MDELLNILNREGQPFFTQLALGQLLTRHYDILPLRVISPIVTVKETTRFKGFYVNPDKTIDIYGDDRVGINLDQFWKNLVIFDIYARPRVFLEKFEDRYRPRVFLDFKDRGLKDKNLVLMPVAFSDLQPGDVRFISEEDTEAVMITHVEQNIENIVVHLLDQFGETQMETYPRAELKDYGDWFYTIIRL